MTTKIIHYRYRENRLLDWLNGFTSNAPLITFRIIFGLLMLYSTLRFWSLGWIEDHYLNTQVSFKYFGFAWVEVLPPAGMYALHVAMIAGALGIALGLFYRFSATLFFLSFTYTELIDLTYYLNHYYFVSLTSFLLIWVPAHRRFSVDVWLWPKLFRTEVPRWAILIFQVQLSIVYIYAGLAKINYDWLIRALPLRIWVPANDTLPLIGPIFTWDITPYLFSWIGMLYDTTIVFWLWWRKTRPLAYLTVIIFHTLTGLMFQIGVFPLVMIGATWIFFSPTFHEQCLGRLERAFSGSPVPSVRAHTYSFLRKQRAWALGLMLSLFFAFQLLFPWRYLLYPGNVFWTEEGYRFSWRVMLMEKAGTTTFYVTDQATGRTGIVDNSMFLNAHQEKQMAMQPDMILQFAHFLADYYKQQGLLNPEVTAEAYVTLNARPSQLLIDPTVDLTKVRDGWQAKDWIFPYE